MPRRARLAIAGIPWHIIQRGNNRSACFYTDDDYLYYLEHLKQQADKFGCRIHAYCLMTNHVHLLLTPEKVDSAALMMKNLGQRYVQYINRTYRRSGTLWEGRFKSCLAQNNEYILQCYQYIELNPVRACMVEHPRNYRWSSFSYNGDGEQNTLVTPHENYTQLAGSKNDRLETYRALLNAGIDKQTLSAIRKATNGNYVLGDCRFQGEITEALGRRVVAGKRGRPKALL